MRRHIWSAIKQQKRFYVQTFRGLGAALIVSLVLNVVLGLAIYFAYISQPDRVFYATSGVIQPIRLNPMLERNLSSEALLAPDVIANEPSKIIPQ